MIYESSEWKLPLLDAATRLRAHAEGEELSESQIASTERDIFIGFYSVRKLLEAFGKITTPARETKLAMQVYLKLPNADPVDWRNRWEVWKLYDMDNPRCEVRDLEFVAHRMIHSFIFWLQPADCGDPAGVLFSSDRDKDKKLYFLPTTQIIHAFEVIGNDYPSVLRGWVDPVSGERRWSVDPE